MDAEGFMQKYRIQLGFFPSVGKFLVQVAVPLWVLKVLCHVIGVARVIYAFDFIMILVLAMLEPLRYALLSWRIAFLDWSLRMQRSQFIPAIGGSSYI